MHATAKLQSDTLRSFLFAGNATFTLRNNSTGNRITYKVRQGTDQETGELKPGFYFVSYLNGPDNWENYEYLGIITGEIFRTTAKTRASADAPCVKGFNWLFRRVVVGSEISEPMEVWHEGSCGRCGRKLTVPESIEAGFGPECINYV